MKTLNGIIHELLVCGVVLEKKKNINGRTRWVVKLWNQDGTEIREIGSFKWFYSAVNSAEKRLELIGG